ncbi:hypothetical protein LTR36_005068 [Oleoguttula mirabilis]|uniref:Uncharacterized protein n=1 Tax=Oleoguttula mirabilis TaxID=1507867 RepID=A0AAV9JXG4_9PEZI|nr:hypothetical protein LTR36_005068 [Oleoguttula mirabilis]
MASHHGSLDSYWKLRSSSSESAEELRKRVRDAGYSAPTGTVKKEMVKMAQRAEKGLLCYDSCSTEELIRFAKNRDIPTADGVRTRENYKSLLEHEDQKATFPRFTAMPPELRCRVYGYYVASIPQELETPTQPPITRVSKLIRNECLPIFDASITFTLTFFRIDRPTPNIRPSPDTTFFLETLAKVSAADIRKLKLIVLAKARMTSRSVGAAEVCTLSLDLDGSVKTGTTGVETCVYRSASLLKDEREARDEREAQSRAMGRGLRQMTKSIDVEKGRWKLKVEDVYAIRRVLLAVFL